MASGSGKPDSAGSSQVPCPEAAIYRRLACQRDDDCLDSGRFAHNEVWLNNVLQRNMRKQLYFTSPRFEIVPNEEDSTNPGCFGQQLAEWICEQMKNLGYPAAEVIPEDFGWCVMCSRRDSMLWIGCSSILSSEAWEIPESERPITIADITWTTFAVAEIPFYDLKSKFLKVIGRIKPEAERLRLETTLEKLLNDQPDITFVPEPLSR